MRAINFTIDDIKDVENSSTLTEAREKMLAILDRCALGNSKSPMKPRKTGFLRERVNKMPTVIQVAKIGYNMLLVGEGLSADSSYQKLMQGDKWRK